MKDCLGPAPRLDAIADYAVYILDTEGRVSGWTLEAERFKGFDAPEILGPRLSRFFTDEERGSGLSERTRGIAAAEARFEYEGWRERNDGTRFWAHVIVDPIRSTSGDLMGFAKITLDLTSRCASAETLLKTEEQFRLLVQGVTDYAIYMLDPTGRVASWNAGARRIKGYEPEEIIGQHFSRFYIDEDLKDGLPKRALATAGTEGRFEHEGWRVRKDGSRFWASVVVDAIRDDEGQLIGFAKITRDITEKRAAQQALEQAHEQLLQARKMEALGQLAGGIAHDFNNLLMAIMGSLELLQKRVPDDPRVARLVDNALQGAHRGVSLTARMLAFSRRQPLTPQPVDLPGLVRGLSDLLRLSLGNNITVETKAPLTVARAMVDPSQLELALLNVASNARDAMAHGGTLTISISNERLLSDQPSGLTKGSYVRLDVSDTGEGMDEETLVRAIDPFFTTKGPGKGTGLGLSVVHGLLNASGGRLVLRSRKGEGTTVEMWLPAAPPEMTPSVRSVQEPNADTPGEPSLTVLTVDDDELVRMNTAMMLEDLGYNVIEAHSGAEALRHLGEHAVDLIITDQGMPCMTGAELAQAARQSRPHMPVILVTGYVDLPKEVVGLGLPKLDKPFSVGQLRAIIAETVG